MGADLRLALRNLLFTAVVPGAGGAYLPWLILARDGARPVAWAAVVPLALGVLLYAWSVWAFAAVGRGTPGPWDPPRRVVATGPYRYVRNPIYLSAMVIILAEAWLFASVSLLWYAGGAAVAFHLLVVAYEEPRLAARFGDGYRDYRRAVPRWLPRRVRPPTGS